MQITNFFLLAEQASRKAEPSAKTPRNEKAFIVPEDSGLDGAAWTAAQPKRRSTEASSKRGAEKGRVGTAAMTPKKRTRVTDRREMVESAEIPSKTDAVVAAVPQQMSQMAQFPHFGAPVSGAPFFPMPVAPQTQTPIGTTVISNYYVSYVLPSTGRP